VLLLNTSWYHVFGGPPFVCQMVFRVPDEGVDEEAVVLRGVWEPYCCEAFDDVSATGVPDVCQPFLCVIAPDIPFLYSVLEV
jgi:hypothetical protein